MVVDISSWYHPNGGLLGKEEQLVVHRSCTYTRVTINSDYCNTSRSKYLITYFDGFHPQLECVDVDCIDCFTQRTRSVIRLDVDELDVFNVIMEDVVCY